MLIRACIRRVIPAIPVALLVFVVACPCNPSSPRGTPSRGIILDAVLQSPGGTPFGHLYASLEETRGDPYPRTLSVSVSDPVFGVASPLAGHVQHIRLLDSTFTIVQEIKVSLGNQNTNSILTTTVFFGAAETPRYDAMRALFLSGKTMVEIDSDLPGLERMRVTMALYRSSDWVTASCD
jgi:hypothetical protein